MNLSIDKKIIIKGDHIYGAAYYYMEASVASMLQELDIKYDVPEIEMELRISQIEKHSGMEPDEMQILAVKEAVKNGLLVITGGPGTIRSFDILNQRAWILHLRHRQDGRQSG